MTECQYKNSDFPLFNCNMLANEGNTHCIFHDKNYLKSDNYEKHKEEVAQKFENKLKQNSNDGSSLAFIGYCLPDICVRNYQFTKPLYLNDATFYGVVDFSGCVFSQIVYFNGSTFYQDADFSKVNFAHRAHFPKCKFSKRANFKESKFHFVDFNNSKLRKVDFSSADFMSDSNFQYTEFTYTVYFQGTKFNGKPSFTFAKFYGIVTFFYARFQKGAGFSNVKFHGDITFTNAFFCKHAYFDYSQFLPFGDLCKVNFSKAMFLGYSHANFHDTKFLVEALFSEIEFQDVFFYNSQFQQVNFSKSKFDRADFSNANFLGECNFDETLFYKKPVSFEAATFHSKTTFVKSSFHADANFMYVVFKRTKFLEAVFHKPVSFEAATFKEEADFIKTNFDDETNFKWVLFEGQEKTFFNTEDLSKVSFLNTDITKVTFDEYTRWGDKDKYKFKVHDEVKFENFLKYTLNLDNIITNNTVNSDLVKILNQIGINFRGQIQAIHADDGILIKSISGYISVDDKNNEQVDDNIQRKQRIINSIKIQTNFQNKAIVKIDDNNYFEFIVKEENGVRYMYLYEEVNLESIKAIYRNLRENYEYRLRYEEAGEFFIREMELKRKYRRENQTNRVIINSWLRRHFSLTALYYHFSTYGESIIRPTAIGAIIISLSTAFWIIQNSPTAEPSLSFIAGNKSLVKTYSTNFINASQIWNNTHTLKAFERSLADLLPLLSTPSNIKAGIMDFVVKIVGGALTFVLLGVAFRRKFERRFRH